jgi:formylglycine-generating enzyme required for sulfatase activity
MGTPAEEARRVLDEVSRDRRVIADLEQLQGEEFSLEKRLAEWRALLAAEQPHEVVLSPFLIAKYELSQREWKQIMGAEFGIQIDDSKCIDDSFPLPVLTLKDCLEFCRRTGLMLPTEAQWEYACRAGTTTAFAFGDELSEEVAFYGGRRRGGPCYVPVHAMVPNPFGLHNMHGNAAEVCSDLYDPAFYSSPETTQKDPCCRRSGVMNPQLHVARGGNIMSSSYVCRSSCRGWWYGAGEGDFTLRPAFSLYQGFDDHRNREPE